jgi:hypothetical protein
MKELTELKTKQILISYCFFLVPTRWRGNAVTTRQRGLHRTLARPDSVPTPARGNQKIQTFRFGLFRLNIKHFQI